jgi:hypothetical protein
MFVNCYRNLLSKNDAFRRTVSNGSKIPLVNGSYLETISFSRREYHGTASRSADATISSETVKSVTNKRSVVDRFQVMAEVTISKIFPAGFGWQTASVFASSEMGYSTDSLNFAVTTGVGDALGVFLGHALYYSAKKQLVDNTINMKKEINTGILLGSAAFCSGTAWQPLVDLLQGANLSFMQVFAGTWIGCGTSFYVGLRMGRTILSGYLDHIQEPTFANSLHDTSLSISIGGATGFFVGTDAVYLPDQNFLIDVVGIKPGMPDIASCAIAGTSTSLGFMTSQSAMNIIYPAKRLWND